MKLNVLTVQVCDGARMKRERGTIRAMVKLYCKGNHFTPEVCDDCRRTEAYCLERLAQCVFQSGKTTCAKCPVHCYAPQQREETRRMMRYGGPRMLYRHPYLAIRHLLDSRSRDIPRDWPQAYPRLALQMERRHETDSGL